MAVVDLQRALVEPEEGRRAKAELERTFDGRQAKLKKAQADLEAMQERFSREQASWTRSAPASGVDGAPQSQPRRR